MAKITAISYLIDVSSGPGEYVNNAPHSFRTHTLTFPAPRPTEEDIEAQIAEQRGEVPSGSIMGWYR